MGRVEMRKDNKPNLLVTAPTYFISEIENEVGKYFNATYAYDFSKSQVSEVIEGIDAWILDPGATYRIDDEILQYNNSLKIIVTPSTGSDHVDLELLKSRNIEFDSLKGKEEIIANIHASAEFSFTLLMSMIRKLVPAVNYAKMGHWRDKEDELRGIELNGKTLGIIGYGRIGKKMANYATAFGSKIMVYDPYVNVESDEIIQVDQIERLLSTSDIVSVHVHLEESTRNLISTEEFNLMKRPVYFLNTARGGIVDEDAMMHALSEGDFFAAIDVISGEQSDDLSNHKLIKFAQKNKNLIISPHIAGATVDSQYKAAKFAVDRIRNFYGK